MLNPLKFARRPGSLHFGWVWARKSEIPGQCLVKAQAEATREAQKAGIAYAKGQAGKYRGRKPSYSAAQIEQVVTLLEITNPNAVAKSVGLSRQAVLRIAADPDAAYRRVAKWQ